MKKQIKPFKFGTVFNQFPRFIENIAPVFKEVIISFPSRLNAMALDPSKISINENKIYNAGQIVFSIDICKKIQIKLLEGKGGECQISPTSERKALIKHAFELMKLAIRFNDSLFIDIDNFGEMKHVGLGSSGALLAGVAAGINELYGNPIKKEEMLTYLSRNYGEEIENSDNLLNPAQSIGGSIATGLWEGGMLLISGNNEVIKTANFDSNYEIIIGIPKNFNVSSEIALNKEEENMPNFIECGKRYGPQIAYRVLHEVLPSMNNQNLKIIGDVIYDYRFNMGSVENCSFLYPQLIELARNLSYLKLNGIADVFAISSVGPAIFVITKNKKECVDAFKKENLDIHFTKFHNSSYKLIKTLLK